jgi:hypothetical protein
MEVLAMEEVNKAAIEAMESELQKTVGGPCRDFEPDDIYNYHDLLRYVGLGVHEGMQKTVTRKPLPNGGSVKEEHHVAHIFPNGDILSRVEIYHYDKDENLKWHKSWSDIYTRGENGKMYESANHEREREVGMVLYHMEECLRELCRDKKAE